MPTARTATSSSRPRRGRTFRREPLRCPHCKLLIGTGRARSEPSEEPGARGSAAGSSPIRPSARAPRATCPTTRSARAIRKVADGHRRTPRAPADGGLPADRRPTTTACPRWPTCSPRSGAGSAPGGQPPIRPEPGSASASHGTGRVPAAMEVLLVLVPFLVAGIAVVFIAFSGGPAAAREAYLTRGGALPSPDTAALRGARHAVPAAVIASRGEAEGGVGKLRTDSISAKDEDGKQLFRQTCWSCHNLDAVQAQGITGPDLDDARARQAAGAQRDQARRHGRRADAGRAAGQGEDADAVADVRGQGRRPVALTLGAGKSPQDAALFRPTLPLCW